MSENECLRVLTDKVSLGNTGERLGVCWDCWYSGQSQVWKWEGVGAGAGGSHGLQGGMVGIDQGGQWP